MVSPANRVRNATASGYVELIVRASATRVNALDNQMTTTGATMQHRRDAGDWPRFLIVPHRAGLSRSRECASSGPTACAAPYLGSPIPSCCAISAVSWSCPEALKDRERPLGAGRLGTWANRRRHVDVGIVGSSRRHLVIQGIDTRRRGANNQLDIARKQSRF